MPADYQCQRPTRAGKFIVALTENSELREQFRSRPAYAVSSHVFPGLTAWERRMLASRDGGRMQVAAKQSRLAVSPAEQFVMKQFLTVTTANFKEPGGEATINAWLVDEGYDTTFADVAAEPTVQATMLLPWTALYANADT